MHAPPATSTARRLLAAACGASAGFHAALVPAHADIAAAALLFAASAVVLGALAIAIERGDGNAIVAGAGVVLAALLVVYAASRTSVVWPLDHREPVDAIGLITKLFEAAGLVLATCLLQAHRTAATVPSGEIEGAQS
jgi:hypothetical protein